MVFNMNIEIADRLVKLRKSNHLSQEALAEKLGISRQAVSKWERAEASPDTDNLIMLARLYHVSLDELLSASDLISLHCPLTKETRHIIREETIAKMKDGVILVNTSRGGLIKTDDLISGIRDQKFFAVGLDVYEEETDFVYEDMSERILPSSTIQRLLSFPNVTMTSHQGFFTEEALTNIAETTLQNAYAFMNGQDLKNEVLS